MLWALWRVWAFDHRDPIYRAPRVGRGNRDFLMMKIRSMSVGADNTGLRLAYCLLDDDPIAAARRLRPVLEKRWAHTGATPMLASPFQTIVPHEWDRFVP